MVGDLSEPYLSMGKASEQAYMVRSSRRGRLEDEVGDL